MKFAVIAWQSLDGCYLIQCVRIEPARFKAKRLARHGRKAEHSAEYETFDAARGWCARDRDENG